MSNDDCLFCRISRGVIPSEQLAASDTHVAFRDINPAAPTHVLIVPRAHHATFDEWVADGAPDAPAALEFIRNTARELGIEGNYRLQVNVGSGAGQEVFHLHWHMLSEQES